MAKINTDVEFKRLFLPTQNKKHVEFEFMADQELLAVKSPMGSGKTMQTIKILQEQVSRGVRSSVIVSARVVFSNNVQSRYNREGGNLDVKMYNKV